MSAVGITRNGFGDVYVFSSREEADMHPIIQYGDAILAEPADLTDQYNILQFPRMLQLTCDQRLVDRIGEYLASLEGKTNTAKYRQMEQFLPEIFEAMVRNGAEPPEDPAEIIQLIRRDRQLHNRKTGVDYMAEKAAAENKKDAAPKEKKEAAPKKVKYPGDHVITMLADKDGKTYGKDHNPKRAGSNSAARFASYTNGMTVEAYNKLYPEFATGDLDNDIAKNYIKVGAKA
jgi:hypothetical protein